MIDKPIAQGEPEIGRDWRGPGRFALVLGLMIFAAFPKVVLGFRTFAVRDYALFSYPVAYFHRLCFWRGELPFWNPYDCCGLPFLAQLNTLTLYPLSLIYLLLPLPWSLSFFCLLHTFLGGMGMYFLAAHWTGSRAGAALAGVVFSFSGLSLTFLMWPSHIATFAWLPWVILLAETGWQEGGRKLVWAALAATMEVLAGGPETILFTWLILLAMVAVQMRKGSLPPMLVAGRFLAIGILALGLAAPQLLPFADFAAHSSRDTHFATSEWSMPPWGWASFLVPLFRTLRWQNIAMQPGQYWTSSYYEGIGVVLLVFVAWWRTRNWRVWLLGGALLVSIVLAMGDKAYLYLWLRNEFPFLGMFRYPVKFVIISTAVIPLLAAFAISHYENNTNFAKRFGRMELTLSGGLVLIVGALLWFARYHTLPLWLWPKTLVNGLSRLGFLGLILLALYFFASRPSQRRWSILLVLAVCWVDVLTSVPWQNPGVDPTLYQAGLGQMDAKLTPAPNIAQSRLMMSPFSANQLYYKPASDLTKSLMLDRAMFLANCNILDDLPKVDGFFSLYLHDCDKILWLLDAPTNSQLPFLEDFLGVSHTMPPGKVFDWVPRTTYLPIVSAGQKPVFASDQAAFAAISQATLNFRQKVYLPTNASSRITAKGQPAARILAKDFQFNRQTIEAETPTPAMVYITQAYYHNWHAAVDGREVPLWRANYAFQAVEIPAGRHEIELTYIDTAYWIGTVLAVLAGVVCLWIWLRRPAHPVCQSSLATPDAIR
ncbi:MAG TPA: YfhO family protein [Candidatus Saccharimonadales bacterium]|nr:YfhO family protein [Candidatus Saccharimonadales bacterium]